MPRRNGELLDGDRVVVELMKSVRACRVVMRGTAGDPIRLPFAAGRRLKRNEEGTSWARGWRSRDANALRAMVAMS